MSKGLRAVRGKGASMHKFTPEYARRAGVPTNFPVYLDDSLWKSDDAAWFELNPERSHRMRPGIEGEKFAVLVNDKRWLEETQPGHVIFVVVRQVEPGVRVRIPFFRNLDVPIPDIEPVVHALFDLVSSGTPDGKLSVARIAPLAMQYAKGGDA